ncbi:hypothetical protein BKA69DRAFT_1165270 [Paraphysoderma sedebokerense]|nr:hypothetical protein BKA69DRAFT_1165270 [Paraphysoderma sedebokerense]
MSASNPFFPGPLVDAIQKTSLSAAILLVFLHLNDPPSAQLRDILSSQDTASLITRNDIVALDLERHSDGGIMFAQVYPVADLPAIYLIYNGTIQSVILGNDVSAESVQSQLEKVVHAVNQMKAGVITGSSSPTSPNQPSPQSPRPTTSSTSPSLTSSSSSRQQQSQRDPRPPTRPSANTASLISNEAEAEKKRREESKVLSEMKEIQKERENQQLIEIRKKQKQKEQEYKRQLLQQIERDRLERRSKFNHSSSNSDLHSAAEDANKSLNSSSSSLSDPGMTNISIRLTDGNVIRSKFNTSDTLLNVREFVDQKRTDPSTPYTLVQNFPKVTYTAQDETKTLVELNLIPSATLILKPAKQISTAYTSESPGVIGSTVSWAYDTTSSVFNWVKGWVQNPTTDSGNQQQTSSSTHPNSASSNSRFQSLHGNSSNDDKDKEKRQTYNGNSTMQE